MPTLTRRQLHRRLLWGTVGMASACGRDPAPTEASTAQLPDLPPLRGVVLITADDLGWRDLSALGLQGAHTPHLDDLLADSISFDRAFDVVSTCSSSRASLATGQVPHTHGVTGLTHRYPELSLPDDAPTLARQLQSHGFATALHGKWHLSDQPPSTFGYDDALDTPIDQRVRDLQPSLDWLDDRAADGKPFFLELNLMQTHRDILDRFVQAEGHEVDPDDAAPPPYWALPDWPELREEVAGYLSQLQAMDAMIGELLDALQSHGMADDTLVVFLSDNGPAFPGCKLTLYDRGLGTPLLFRWPAALTPTVHDQLVATTQVAPTVLALAGAPPLGQAQGTSLAPVLLQLPHEPASQLFLEMEQHVDPHPARALRTERYKYIRNLSDAPWGRGDGNADYVEGLAELPDQRWDDPRPPEELYDLDADPLERDNLVDDPAHASILDDLRRRLHDEAERLADPRLEEL
jgi:arylsulfatase A-like enzyme